MKNNFQYNFQVVSAKFSSTLNRIIITFDGVVKKAEEKTALSDMFQSNHTAFGKKSYFKFSSKRLFIFLLGGPTIRTGNLVLDTRSLKSGAGKTIYSNTTIETITLDEPEKVRMPDVVIMGPSSVGKTSIHI